MIHKLFSCGIGNFMKEKIKRQAKDHLTTETLIYQNCVDGTCQKNTYIRPNIVVYSKNEATVYSAC